MILFILNLISYVMRRFTNKAKTPSITRGGITERDGFASGNRPVFGFATPGSRRQRSPKKGHSPELPPESYFTRSDFRGGRPRRESFVNVEGGGKSIAVLTSGGDAQGIFYFYLFLFFGYEKTEIV